MEQTRLSNLRTTKAFRVLLTSVRIRTIATAIILVAGCGDAPATPFDGIDDGAPGGGDPGAEYGELLIGVLSAPPTAGISYETASQSGVTDEYGAFEYREGESVRFFLGDTTLGEIGGEAEITPFDLAGIAPLTTGYRGFEEARDEVSRAANIATLLQTFDQDGDPANGIEISAEVASLFEGVEVDFSRDIFEFARERTFRSVLNRANELDLFDDHRRPRGGIAVMDAVYDELGISAGFHAPLVEGFDDDADGTEDRLREYAFEAQSSKVLITERNSGLPGVMLTTEYDEDGNVLSKVEARSPGMPVFGEYWEADADGNLTIRSLDQGADLYIDSRTAHLYTEFGEVRGIEQDQNADGTADRIYKYGYDARGNRTSFESDTDADGAVDRAEAYVWNADRNLVQTELDEDGDGVFETLDLYEYDAHGRLIGRARYQDGNGSPSFVRLWEYDAEGWVARYSEDNDGDGTLDSIEHNDYDAEGRIIRTASDDDGDGQIDRIRSWLRDPDGNVSRYEYDTDADGIIGHIVDYSYDEHANVVREEIDFDGDGTPDKTIRRHFVPVDWGYLFYKHRDRSARP